MTKIAAELDDWEERNLRFVAINEHGLEVDWIDPVVGFTEYDEYWAVENPAHVYMVAREKGYSYDLISCDEHDV